MALAIIAQSMKSFYFENMRVEKVIANVHAKHQERQVPVLLIKTSFKNE